MTCRSVRTWIDENTGRTVRQLTAFEGRTGLEYFRHERHLRDGRMIARTAAGERQPLLVDPDSGDVQPLGFNLGHYLRFRPADGRYFFVGMPGRAIMAVSLPDGTPEEVGRIPDDLTGWPDTITCDGRYVIVADLTDAPPADANPASGEAADFWRYMARPRHGALRSYDLTTGERRTLVETQGKCPFHCDASPSDPTLVRFALDHWEGHNQRAWATRADGSTEPWPIRPQERGELVTHEYWWADGAHIGFTFQDRRNDPSSETLPWCEYGLAPTRLGMADTDGRQVYLSDPVNHYHTHLYCSRDGRLISGSGTDGHSFVHAAAFDPRSTRIDLIPLATVHTPYVPFRGQGVNCDFSADGRWLLYSDLIGSHHQLCAVGVDLRDAPMR